MKCVNNHKVCKEFGFLGSNIDSFNLGRYPHILQMGASGFVKKGGVAIGLWPFSLNTQSQITLSTLS